MRSTYTRGPDRLFLIHAVTARLKDRGWWSAHQAAKATYFGNGRLHRQQRRRVRFILDRYVEAGILERDDTIAACPLYPSCHSPRIRAPIATLSLTSVSWAD